MKYFKPKNIKKHNIPPWSKVVESMHDKGLNYIEGYKIVNVIYSPNNEHRFVILEVNNSYLTYSFESLQPYDEDELIYCSDNNFAYWTPQNYCTKSMFKDIEILMHELKTTPEYKTFFDNN